MNELQVKANLTTGVINFNFEEIKEQVKSIADAYDGATFHEDTVKEAKSSVATLRKIKTAINDRKIEVKKEYNKPYTDFENQVKELFEIIEKPIDEINDQVQEFEKKEKEKKKERIAAIYEEFTEEVKSVFSLESVFNPKWLNKGYLTDDIKLELENIAQTVANDLVVIKSMNSEVEEKAIELYKINMQLSSAIQYINDDNKRKQEIMQKEKDRIAKEEADRIRAEERAKIEQEKHVEEVKEETRVETQQKVIESLTPEIAEDEQLEECTYKIKLNADAKSKLEMFMNSVGIEFEEEVEAWL